jgi:hypothetical protein
MHDLPTLPGVILRARDDTLFFVPLADLVDRYRLPDDQQRGSATGDGVLGALDSAPSLVGLKNAILSDRLVVTEADPTSPSGGKQRFAPGLLESVETTVPSGGKQRFATGLLDEPVPVGPTAGKQRFAVDPEAE